MGFLSALFSKVLTLVSLMGVPALVGAPIPITATGTIAQTEDLYFASHGKYYQVLAGNKVPAYQTGTTLSELGFNIGMNVRVDTYSSPKGKGYVIISDDGITSVSTGYGPMAKEYTHTEVRPTLVATSTK